MARSSPSACIEAGCPELAHKGSRCTVHSKAYKRDYTKTDNTEERQRLTKFYGGRMWRSLSKAVRTRQPLCVMCSSSGLTTPADMVDHIVPVRIAPELRLKVSNLQPLCNSCHTKKTNTDKKTYAL